MNGGSRRHWRGTTEHPRDGATWPLSNMGRMVDAVACGADVGSRWAGREGQHGIRVGRIALHDEQLRHGLAMGQLVEVKRERERVARVMFAARRHRGIANEWRRRRR